MLLLCLLVCPLFVWAFGHQWPPGGRTFWQRSPPFLSSPSFSSAAVDATLPKYCTPSLSSDRSSSIPSLHARLSHLYCFAGGLISQSCAGKLSPVRAALLAFTSTGFAPIFRCFCAAYSSLCPYSFALQLWSADKSRWRNRPAD